jgi:hypothetical protein
VEGRGKRESYGVVNRTEVYYMYENVTMKSIKIVGKGWWKE